MRCCNWHWFCLFVLLMVLAGCGGKSETAAPQGSGAEPEAAATSSGGAKFVAADKLPKRGDPLPPLDGGRVEIAPPRGWRALPRHNDYVARFSMVGKEVNDRPRILITVADAGSDLPAETTSENVAELAEAIAAELESRKGVVEQPKALVIGDNPFARYVMAAQTRARLPIERQILETTFDGRRYTIMLEVDNEIKPETRDLGYSVAAGMKFRASSGGGRARPPMEEEE